MKELTSEQNKKMNTLNFGITGSAEPTETSPNVFTAEQKRFLQMVVDTEFFSLMRQSYFDTFLSKQRGTEFEEFKRGYIPKNFHNFIVNVLKQGRYGNISDSNKLRLIRTIWIYSKK